MTGQSALIETGYIAQHLASLLLAIPGQGFRGKGIDMRARGPSATRRSLFAFSERVFQADDTDPLEGGRP
jgi:hypothetical protein